jgi:hypothetical protein
MKRISSRDTFFSKKVFPVLWFGLIACIAVAVAFEGKSANFSFLVGPAFMAIVGFVLMKKLIWCLADEVYDCGDYLLVRKAGEEENVLLSNIMNVSATSMTNPPRITLRLVNPGKFGKEIAFSPVRKFTLNPFPKNEIYEDLIVRVDQARSKRTF